jgi:UDPglucose 6-dehydrogenase
MKITVVGAGYVGLTTAVSLAYIGHEVVVVEKDQQKLALLQQGKSPIYEVGMEPLMAETASNITYTNDLVHAVSSSNVILIAVGTPARPEGDADIRYVEEVAVDVAKGLQSGGKYTIVVKSTVPVGTGRRVALVVNRILAERATEAKVMVASNPEFLQEGKAIKDTLFPDRIVVGAGEAEAVEALRRMYRPILEQTFAAPSFLPRPEGYTLPPMITTDSTSAEMLKYAANAFLALKISFINEIAGLCEKVGGDVTEVARGIGCDPRIGKMFLQAGLGWGGACFPKDTSALMALAAEYGYEMPIVKAAKQVNMRQRQMIIEKLQTELKVIRGRTIGFLGLAFKPNTDDVREAPALQIMTELIRLGAHVKAHDPIAIENAKHVINNAEVEYHTDVYNMAEQCDAIVLATEWDEYRKLNIGKLAGLVRGKILIDGRNFFEPERFKEHGFDYVGVGR